MNQSERNTHKKEFERINRRFEKKYYPKVQKAIKSKVSSLINVIRETGIDAGHRFISTDLTNVELSNTVKKLYLEVGLQYARKEYRRQRQDIRTIGFPKKKAMVLKTQSVPMETKGFGFNEQWVSFILQYLQQFLIEKITFSVAETTREKLLDILQTSIAEGYPIDEMVARIEKEGLFFARWKSALITRTEINRAANVGTMAGVNTSEYEMNKEWIAARDKRTRGNPYDGHKDRADHWSLDGQIVDIDGKFKDPRNGHELSHPGDPDAKAEDVCNCRCSIAPIPKRDANGYLVPKPQLAAIVPMLGVLRPPIAASPNVGVRVGVRPSRQVFVGGGEQTDVSQPKPKPEPEQPKPKPKPRLILPTAAGITPPTEGIISEHISYLAEIERRLRGLAHIIRYDRNAGAVSSEVVELVDMAGDIADVRVDLEHLKLSIDIAQEELRLLRLDENTLDILRERLERSLKDAKRKMSLAVRKGKQAIEILTRLSR